MHIRLPAGLLIGFCTASLAATVWAAAQTEPSTLTPRQVAAMLDGIVQPRFQANAGRFGVDRVVVNGHDNVYELDAETASDQSKLKQVKLAKRPFVIAFLHCTHKPGHDVGVKGQQLVEDKFSPYIGVLATGTKTDSGTDRLYNWGEAHLNGITTPYLPALRLGHGAEAERANWVVVMRPVRATRASCVACHQGAKRGDTLGVMVYAIDKNVNHDPIKSFQAGYR